MSAGDLFHTDPASGELLISAEGLAALIGVSADDVREHAAEHGTDPQALPADWQRSARRRAAEYRAATGGKTLPGAITYYADGIDR